MVCLDVAAIVALKLPISNISQQHASSCSGSSSSTVNTHSTAQHVKLERIVWYHTVKLSAGDRHFAMMRIMLLPPPPKRPRCILRALIVKQDCWEDSFTERGPESSERLVLFFAAHI
jgi:hypothetical protein